MPVRKRKRGPKACDSPTAGGCKHPTSSPAPPAGGEETRPTILPLSTENLREFERMTSTPPTPTASKPSTVTSKSISAREVRRRLSTYRIYADKEDVFQPTSAIRIFSEGIVHGERNSPGLSNAEQTNISTISCRMQDEAEANVMDAIVPLLFPLPEIVFGRTNLAKNRDVEFLPNRVPTPSTTANSILTLALDAAGCLKNPKPDLCFGYPKSAFDDDSQRDFNDMFLNLTGLSRGIYHPFMIVEWKSSATGGTQYDAQNQAMRSGAALVSARLDLFLRINEIPPPPTETCVFSCTVDTYTANIHIHWCEVDEASGARSFHMNTVSDVMLKRPDEVRRLRREIENIMDWGLDVRLVKTKQVVALAGDLLTVRNEGAKKRKRVII
ncbi:hypothetical protein GP486_003296 [Trichoglossum hirsutum]|uniref:DUF7924 domain-containing protein n=1 Tax=Trichoglossum hirsutum TaxID=265104 RepID=A0A9P8LDC2_9PEZI|nr:hypothetical protein GP486_003296 [Trichoglossum hirsutum]